MQRTIRTGLVTTLAALGIAATTALPAQAAPVTCRKGDFCLFSGHHQTGEVLYRLPVKVTRTGFTFPEVDELSLPAAPLSARNPIPDDFGCIVRLNDKPHFAGSEQEIDGFGAAELTGAPVASITPDCG
ncbi:hypothetical protein [Streptomyces sp. NBRC 110611]|uniref:hypothetical protein n=1 Tax=Streptomyces sp. NBRC 110611 TaxID=1621259 RepID=UPI00082B2AA8|nr:hypothetical protein [Streptomyces sp. NBRC 110611]